MQQSLRLPIPTACAMHDGMAWHAAVQCSPPSGWRLEISGVGCVNNMGILG